ncbi:Fc.00g027530.m01.CDS01 [Cosmosporella sp. VM-42]
MEGWYPCSIPENRECWLRNRDGGEFNIHTDYEKFAPVGITRHYTLVAGEGSWNADGQNFPDAKTFNHSHPGPWLEACWGDTLNITVINNMTTNGTSIHWHGIRQNQTMDMDGVNGITQCPIAPGESFTYTFKATQYGTSWYHSHYSMQYADGLQGPLTIHGPVSAPFDTSKRPLLMTDWSHVSAYQLLWNRSLGNKTILLNGNGSVAHFGYTPTLDIPKNYELHFNKTPTDKPRRPTRYLLRLINTSFDSAFVFSIDNHWLQIVTSDFVPIEPYFNTSVLIGIGQRYNVIVEANPLAGDANPFPVPNDGNFWIRTWLANKCTSLKIPGPGYEETGILRYNKSSTDMPRSLPWVNISKACSDETYTSLRPKIPWFVGPAANARYDDDFEQFNVTLNTAAANTPPFVHYPMAKFSLEKASDSNVDFRPLQIDYGNPTIMHLNESVDDLPSKWVVIPEDYTEDQWIYLVLTMDNTSVITAAHPIHLHGHDFALLQQEENQYYDPSKLNLTLDNPPRRDVVLLPTGGFVVIAFKADNPGSWLMHCHIARHASEGLALQILERQGDADKLFPPNSDNMVEARRVCASWKKWQDVNHAFEGDSGI